jgi:hypothetical protein
MMAIDSALFRRDLCERARAVDRISANPSQRWVRELPLTCAIPNCEWELPSAQVPGNARRTWIASRTAASDCRTRSSATSLRKALRCRCTGGNPLYLSSLVVFRTKPLGESNEAVKLRLCGQHFHLSLVTGQRNDAAWSEASGSERRRSVEVIGRFY